MIAVDFTSIKPVDGMRNFPKIGVDVYLDEMLRGIEEAGCQDEYALFVTKEQFPFVKQIYPKYRLRIVPFSAYRFTFLRKLVRTATFGRMKLRKAFDALSLLFKQAAFAYASWRYHAEAVWFPDAVPGKVVSVPVEKLLTVHDLIRLHGGNPESGLRAAYEKMLKGASVVAISEYVKQDIESRFGCCHTIHVVPNAVTVHTEKQKSVSGLEGARFILDINAYDARKNAITLIRAFDRIADQTDCRLVFCGYKRRDYEKVCAARDQSPYADRILILSDAPADEKNWLIAHCIMLVTPSLDEGFGRTPIEAAICRRPVLSTKCTSLHEATMGLVHYVSDPMKPEEYADKMIEMIENPDSEEKLEKIGKTLSQAYCAQTVAKKLHVFFRQVIEKEGKR